MTDKKHVTSTTRTSEVKVNLGLSCQESTKKHRTSSKSSGGKFGRDHPGTSDGPITSGWEADGDRDRGDIATLCFFFNNKVTKEERSAERQSARRYKQDRRSDSLKRYRSVFDFPRPNSQALQNNLAGSELRFAPPIVISNTQCARLGRDR